MAKKDIFVNQTTNVTVQLVDTQGNPIAVSGVLAVDIAGALGGAKMTTQIKHANATVDQWISIADGTWPFNDTEVYNGTDGSIIPLNSHFVRFMLTGASEVTSLSVTAGW